VNALYYDVLTAVRDKVLSLSLDGIPAEQVYLRKVPTDRGCALPCVLIAPWGMEQEGEGDFEDNDLGYPVLIVFVSASDADLTLSPVEMLWREQVLDSLINPPLPLPDGAQAPDCYQITPESGAVVDLARWLENLAVGWLLVRCWACKSRGRT
jgi:hypothetical protein